MPHNAVNFVKVFEAKLTTNRLESSMVCQASHALSRQEVHVDFCWMTHCTEQVSPLVPLVKTFFSIYTFQVVNTLLT